MSLSIEGQHDRRRIVLPIAVLQPAPSTDLGGMHAKALLDTGATASGITPRIAKGLALAARGKRPLGSAHGEAQVERYLFRIALQPDRLSSDPPTFPYVFPDIIGFELTNSFHFDALLGMDILTQCDFHLSKDGWWRLRFGQ